MRAQQTERIRRIGVLMGFNESDPIIQKALDAFGHGLRKVGWEMDEISKLNTGGRRVA